MIGSGLLTLPWVTAQAGLGLSLVGLLILAVLTQAAIRLVVRCVVHEKQLAGAVYVDVDNSRATTQGGHGDSSWHLVANAAFGRLGWYVTSASLITAQLGVVSSYLDFVGNTLIGATGMGALSSRLLLWGICTSLCMLRVLKSVAWLSMTALCVYAYIIVLIGVYGAQAAPSREDALVWFAPSHFGQWFGPSLFAFEGMGTALSIYESMGAADARPFYAVISAAYAVGVLVYGGVAAVGYVAWGEDVASVVIRSFPRTPIGLSAQLMLALVLLLSYPLQIHPVFQVLEAGLGAAHPAARAYGWPLLRAAVVGATAGASYLISDMESMVGLTGALAFSSIGFVLPGLFFLKLRPPKLDASGAPPSGAAAARPSDGLGLEMALALVMVVLGVVGGSWGVYTELSKVGAA